MSNKEGFEKKCRKLLTEVRRNFPSLENVKIKLMIKPLEIGSMFALKKPFHYVLIIDSVKYKNANNKQIIGVLAHELMHFETYERYGWMRYFMEAFAFYFSKRLMAKFERKNDKKTIEKGYARELYANRVYRLSRISKSYLKKIGHCYLLPKEIKSYAIKIKKW